MSSSTSAEISRVADELICSADLDGYYTDVNPAFTRLLGWSEAELVNQPYLEFVHPEDRRATEAALRRLRASGKLVELRNRYVAKDGRHVWIEWRAYLHDDAVYAIGRERLAASEEDKLEDLVLKVFRERATAEEARLDSLQEKREQAQSERSAAQHSASVAHTKAKTFQVWIAALLAASGAVGGVLAWAIKRVEANAVRAQQTEQRRQDVDEKIERLDGRMKMGEAKIQRLGELADETSVQVSESTDYIVKKIDAAHPRVKEEVTEPPAVQKAREKVELIKKARRVEDLFKRDPDDPDNPFADLDTEGLDLDH